MYLSHDNINPNHPVLDSLLHDNHRNPPSNAAFVFPFRPTFDSTEHFAP